VTSTRAVLGFRPLGQLPQALGEDTTVRVRLFFSTIEIDPLAGDAGRCRYSDEIEVRAGALPPLVWLYAQLFYRYRQRRWRRLERSPRD
jgi:hypothetical protein